MTVSQNAAALEPIGWAADVDPDAAVQLQGRQTTVLTGADLYQGQLITTGGGGQVQILFTDETRMVVGPNSQLVLETYLLRGDNSVASFAVDALGGTFRFITGDSDKDAYQINTPSGTIGVRGTKFDLFVDGANQLGIVWLLEGGVRMCSHTGGCVDLVRQCDFGAMPRNTSATLFDPDDGQFEVNPDNFPYEISQLPLRRDFRVASARACARQHSLRELPFIRTASSDRPRRATPNVVDQDPVDEEPEEDQPEQEDDDDDNEDRHSNTRGNGHNNGHGNGQGHNKDKNNGNGHGNGIGNGYGLGHGNNNH